MVGLGVASFGHMNGVHVQNLDTWETYAAAIRRDEIPLNRAYHPTHEERLIREFILQLKLGSIRPAISATSTAPTCCSAFASRSIRSLPTDTWPSAASSVSP